MSHSSNPALWPAASALVLLFAVSLPLLSQELIQVQAGSSSLLDAQGISVDFRNSNHEGYIGLGEIGGRFLLGARGGMQLGGNTLVVGDNPLQIELPTDVFGGSHYFLTRGVSVQTNSPDWKLLAFAGMSAVGGGASFFQAAQVENPTGLLFLDVPLSHRLQFYSRNVVSRQQTFVDGLNFRVRPWLQLAAAAGVGSNQAYGATSLDLDRGWLKIKAAYIDAGDRFRRITVQAPINSEYARENILVTLKPHAGMIFVLGHQNLLQPQSDLSLPFLRGTVNQIQGAFDFAHFRWGTGLFESTVGGRHNLGEAAWLSRQLTRRLEAGVNYYRSQTPQVKASSVVSGILRETLSPRIGLLQLISSSNGQRTVSFGGNYLSNRFSIGLDYQTVYVPFLAQPFKQGMGVTLQLRPFGGIELNGQTFLGPDGRTRYTASGSSMLYQGSRLLGGNGSGTYRLARYIIRGRVVDDQGLPIGGAAVRIDSEVLLTNSAGQFFVRKKRAGNYSIAVAFDQFLSPARFELLSCPDFALAQPEEMAPEVLVVLRPARAASRP